jgi:hypothetical protein
MQDQLPSPSVVAGPLKRKDLPSIRQSDETRPACPPPHNRRPDLAVALDLATLDLDGEPVIRNSIDAGFPIRSSMQR